MAGANSRNQEKGVIFQAWVPEILKKGKISALFLGGGTVFMISEFQRRIRSIKVNDRLFMAIQQVGRQSTSKL